MVAVNTDPQVLGSAMSSDKHEMVPKVRVTITLAPDGHMESVQTQSSFAAVAEVVILTRVATVTGHTKPLVDPLVKDPQ